MAKAKKADRVAKKKAKRRMVFDCAEGDVVELDDGRIVMICAWLNGGILGRYLDWDEEGEFEPISDQPMKLREDLQEARRSKHGKSRFTKDAPGDASRFLDL